MPCCYSPQVMEQAATVQKEVSATVAEMVKSHKQYGEEEHLSHDSRTKAETIEKK